MSQPGSLEILTTPETLAERAAEVLAAALSSAVEARGQATLAVSGGSTPGAMLAALAQRPVPWAQVHVLQVDERVTPDGHPDRNLTQLQERLVAAVPGIGPRLHAMPVLGDDLTRAARRYAEVLVDLAGDPPVLDVIQLGMGADGHTASLVTGDPVLDITDHDVAPTGVYQGRRRLTCTFPVLARARQRIWLVSGAAKADALARVLADDTALPASRLPKHASLWLVDTTAAAHLDLPDDRILPKERP